MSAETLSTSNDQERRDNNLDQYNRYIVHDTDGDIIFDPIAFKKPKGMSDSDWTQRLYEMSEYTKMALEDAQKAENAKYNDKVNKFATELMKRKKYQQGPNGRQEVSAYSSFEEAHQEAVKLVEKQEIVEKQKESEADQARYQEWLQQNANPDMIQPIVASSAASTTETSQVAASTDFSPNDISSFREHALDYLGDAVKNAESMSDAELASAVEQQDKLDEAYREYMDQRMDQEDMVSDDHYRPAPNQFAEYTMPSSKLEATEASVDPTARELIQAQHQEDPIASNKSKNHSTGWRLFSTGGSRVEQRSSNEKLFRNNKLYQRIGRQAAAITLALMTMFSSGGEAIASGEVPQTGTTTALADTLTPPQRAIFYDIENNYSKTRSNDLGYEDSSAQESLDNTQEQEDDTPYIVSYKVRESLYADSDPSNDFNNLPQLPIDNPEEARRLTIEYQSNGVLAELLQNCLYFFTKYQLGEIGFSQEDIVDMASHPGKYDFDSQELQTKLAKLSKATATVMMSCEVSDAKITINNGYFTTYTKQDSDTSARLVYRHHKNGHYEKDVTVYDLPDGRKIILLDECGQIVMIPPKKVKTPGAQPDVPTIFETPEGDVPGEEIITENPKDSEDPTKEFEEDEAPDGTPEIIKKDKPTGGNKTPGETLQQKNIDSFTEKNTGPDHTGLTTEGQPVTQDLAHQGNGTASPNGNPEVQQGSPLVDIAAPDADTGAVNREALVESADIVAPGSEVRTAVDRAIQEEQERKRALQEVANEQQLADSADSLTQQQLADTFNNSDHFAKPNPNQAP